MPQSCPICSKPISPDYKPFCSERCRHVDLNRWFTGAYAVPAEAAEAEDEGVNETPESDENLH